MKSSSKTQGFSQTPEPGFVTGAAEALSSIPSNYVKRMELSFLRNRFRKNSKPSDLH
jgi:hypothetical protein